MKVKVARTAGFCTGVRRAVNIAIDASHDHPDPVHTLGPLIHNPQVIQMLGQRGLEVAQELPDEGAVIIRSHGVTPRVRREIKARGLTMVDATCPRVARVHGIANAHHKKGFQVVVVGDPGHAEVDGIVGWADNEALVIQRADQVASLPAANKICLVAQTTQEREVFTEVVEALRERFGHLPPERLVIADTICDSTRNRQDEVRRLAREVDAVVVVGGKGSANSRRLAEVAREEGAPAYSVETEEELDEAEMSKYRVVGLTAGASTPNWMIRRVHDRLITIRPRRGLLTGLADTVRWLVMSNLYMSLGAAGLTLASAMLQGFLPLWREFYVNFLFVFAVHTLTLISDPQALALNVPARHRSFTRFRKAWIGAALAAAGLAVALGYTVSAWYGLGLSVLAVVSLLYPVRLIRSGPPEARKIRSLSEIPASKDIFMALGWAMLIVNLPLLGRPPSSNPAATAVTFLLISGIVFVRALLRDFRDIQADRLIGRETLPIVIGLNRTRAALLIILVALAGLLLGAVHFEIISPPRGIPFLVVLLYQAACVPLFARRMILQGFRAELIIDGVFLLAGFIEFVQWEVIWVFLTG